ncbi:MAG: exodeoxyribonuclease III [Erysipelotrichaceae bacterium]|nr:exodeoxyribonuclease III [Erysipelotrichaceae bacterium]
MKLVSWNVNGIRACVQKGFYDFFQQVNADIFCIQETKMQPNQLEIISEGYYQYMNSAVKKGYSGVMVFTKQKPLSVSYGMGIEKHDQEGRLITLEFEGFYFVGCYTPNSKDELARLPYRMEWEDDFRTYLNKLDEKKPVILCGDLNVAHQEIDLKNPKTNRNSAGFSDEERAKLTQLLESGFIDTFRYLNPEKIAYSWWSYRFNARARNAGWRIDYFIVSERLGDLLKQADIHTDITGSDHCPVSLEINLP